MTKRYQIVATISISIVRKFVPEIPMTTVRRSPPAITDTIAEALSMPMTSLPSGGKMTRSACGMMM